MKKIISLILIILLLSGCASNDVNMNIDNNSVMFSETITFDSESFEIFNDTLSNVTDEYNVNGFNVKKTNDGYVISKNLGKLYKLANGKNERVNLGGFALDTFESNKLFKETNYILFSKYESNFNIDYSSMDSVNSINKILYNDEEEISKEYYDKISGMLNNGITTSFSLTTNNRGGNNNASSKYNNKYNWNLIYDMNNSIEFEIYVINKDAFIILGVIILICVIIGMIVSKRNNLMYKISKTTIKDSLELENKIMNSGKKVKDSNKFDNKDVNAINNRGRN